MSARKQSRYEFDVALSVAGEDRQHAKKLAGLLRLKGYSVFYYKDQRAHLWGKGKSDSERIYGPSSRYVIPLISQHYVKKDWTLHEFGTAKREAKTRKDEFILPIRIDDTPLLGLPDDVFFLDLRRDSMEDVASWFEEKCELVRGKGQPIVGGKTKASSGRARVAVLSLNAREALGLLATSSIRLKMDHYEALFPAIEWRKVCRTLVRQGLIAKKDGFLHVLKSASRPILAEERERDERLQQWLSVLEPLRDHVDTALTLATHYGSLRRFDDAAIVLSNIVDSTALGRWAALYRRIIQLLAGQPFARRLASESRIRLYNSLGILLSQTGLHDEAIEAFAKLRRLSQRLRHDWGVGQSYINTGVAYHRSGRQDQADRYYRRAISHARRKNDRVLLGRSLGNLAQTIMHDNPDAAADLLEESIAEKRSARDVPGVVAAYGALGELAAVNGRFERAIHWCSKSATVAKAANLPYEHSLALYNLGRAHYDSSQRWKAKKCYKQALGIARKEGYRDVQILALPAIVAIHFEDRRFEQAAAELETMLDLAVPTGGGQDVVCALHGLGLIRLSQNRNREGRQYLNRAIRNARSNKSSDWIARCLVDRSRPVVNGEFGRPSLRKLRRSAVSEQKRGMHDVAADLWQELAEELIRSGAPAADIESAFAFALECLDQLDARQADAIELYTRLYSWRWENGEYESGITALKFVEEFAAASGLHRKRIQAIDQQGICLQELQRYDEAETLHRLAIKGARRLGDKAQVHISLNNLGELLRKRGKHRKAISAFTEAEDVARSLGNREGVLMTSHNRALALEDVGDEQGSSNLLEQCRTRALRWKLWDEYVRAWEGLANLARCQKRLGLAERRYARAFTEAKTKKCLDMRPRIALNYARLLRTIGKSKKALRILGAFEDEFQYRVDSLLYYRTLAELYADAGRFEEARVHWLAAKTASEKVGTPNEVALCIAGLTDALQELGQPREADEYLKSAVKRETCLEVRVALLIERLRLLLKTDRLKEAERIFQEAREIARVNDFTDAFVEMHMVLGEHYWAGEYDSKLNALKAYLAALVEAFRVSPDKSAEIGMHVVRVLTGDSTAPCQSDLDSLIGDVRRWLVEETNETIVKFALWPLRYAKELLPYVGKPKQFQRTMKALLADKSLFS